MDHQKFTQEKHKNGTKVNLHQKVEIKALKNLKIAYIFDWQGKADAGVVKKVEEQVLTWMNIGVTVEVFLIRDVLSEDINFSATTHKYIYKSNWERILSRNRALYWILRNRKGWLIYRRYGLFTPFDVLAMSMLDTVIEINTNNKFFYKERSILQFIWFKTQDYWIGKLSFGACAVTEELKAINSSRYSRIAVFTNAISLDTFKAGKKIRSSNKLIFLAGDDFSWNGLDLIEIIARSLPDYMIEVFGIQSKKSSESNVHFFDYLPSHILPEKLNEYLAGIATLQLENVGLTEAAPLKTRQYLLNGLPVIARFRDSGIDESAPFVFIIDIDIKNKKIYNKKELRDFLLSCRNLSINKSDLQKMDVKEVEMQRIQYLKGLNP
jgi:hypothetical protein